MFTAFFKYIPHHLTLLLLSIRSWAPDSFNFISKMSKKNSRKGPNAQYQFLVKEEKRREELKKIKAQNKQDKM